MKYHRETRRDSSETEMGLQIASKLRYKYSRISFLKSEARLFFCKNELNEDTYTR